MSVVLETLGQQPTGWVKREGEGKVKLVMMNSKCQNCHIRI